MPLLSLQHIQKEYIVKGTIIPALRDTTLNIYPGEFVAIMGPSGSGKSTLLNILAGLDTPTTGTFYYRGHNVKDFSDAMLARYRQFVVGITFERFNLIRGLSTKQNLFLPRLFSRKDKKHMDFDSLSLLLDLNIEKKKNTHIQELSFGEQQRTSIARSLINDPEIILFDEPTGNLDSENTKKIMQIIHHLQDEKNKTIIVVTHNPDVAKEANRILYLQDGEVIKEEEVRPFPKQDVSPDISIIEKPQKSSISLFEQCTFILSFLLSDKLRAITLAAIVSFSLAAMATMIMIVLPTIDALTHWEPSDISQTQIIATGKNIYYFYDGLSTYSFENISTGRNITNTSLKDFQTLPGATSATPLIPYKVTIGKETFGAQSFALTKDYNPKQTILAYGHYFTSDNENAILINEPIAQSLAQGQPLQSLIGKHYASTIEIRGFLANRTLIIHKNLVIAGILLYESEFNLPLLPANFDNLVSSHVIPIYSGALVQFSNSGSIQQAEAIMKSEGYITFSQTEALLNLQTFAIIATIIDSIVIFIIAISAILSIFNIISAIVISKQKAFAIFQAIGASVKDIQTYILTESITLAIIEGIIACFIAFGSAWLLTQMIVYFLLPPTQLIYDIYFDYPIWIFVFICIFSFIISFVFAGFLAISFSRRSELINELKRE